MSKVYVVFREKVALVKNLRLLFGCLPEHLSPLQPPLNF